MVLSILTHPNPILRQKARDIQPEEIKNSAIQKLIFDMKETIGPAGGIGLAAPQVNASVRIIVINLKDQKTVLINPIITRFSWRKETAEEGCLSVPGKFGYVKRAKTIRAEAFNERGEPIKFKATGLFARVIQHEVDHLNGVLFIDKTKRIFANSAPSI